MVLKALSLNNARYIITKISIKTANTHTTENKTVYSYGIFNPISYYICITISRYTIILYNPILYAVHQRQRWNFGQPLNKQLTPVTRHHGRLPSALLTYWECVVCASCVTFRCGGRICYSSLGLLGSPRTVPWRRRFETLRHPTPAEHDDVMTRKRFPHYWPFVRWIHRSPADSPHKGSVMHSFNVSSFNSQNTLCNAMCYPDMFSELRSPWMKSPTFNKWHGIYSSYITFSPLNVNLW